MFDRKERALMIVIERIIARHHQGHIHLDEESFKLFELAKRIHHAENEAGFQAAVAGLGCTPEVFKPSLLRHLTTVAVPGATTFVAADHFKVDISETAQVRIADFEDDFQQFFLDKIEIGVEGVTLNVHSLEKKSLDVPILAELGERAETQLVHFWKLLKRQPNGESNGPLFVTGRTNIFYIRDTDNNLCAVGAYWRWGAGWCISAHSVGSAYGWVDGYVFAR